MNTVTVTLTELIVEAHGPDKIWGLHSTLRFPLTYVRGATADTGIVNENPSLRAPGIALPGKYVGTFHRDGQASFWNVSDPANNLVIQLEHETFTRLVLTVDQPRDLEQRINAAL